MELINFKFSLFFLLFLLTGCFSKKINVKKENKINSDFSRANSFIDLARKVYLKVEGVECKYCAQVVIHELEKINGILSAEYENFTEDYDNNRIKLVYNNNDLESIKNQISKILCEEGFGIKSIESV